MQQSERCRVCGKNVGVISDGAYDENGEYIGASGKEMLGINKKLHGMMCGSYYCFECLCEREATTPRKLRGLIDYYKSQGCGMF